MTLYSLQDAQDHLKKLITAAQNGETVVILDDHDRAVQLVPLAHETKARKPGSARGKIQMSSDFDAPLADFDDYTR